MIQFTPTGIDDMSIYIPKLYLDIKVLAEARGIEYPKLSKGLGLLKMATPDVHEDTATMAANVVLELIEKNDLSPKEIGRIYLGTESALDGSKPTGTYVLQMLDEKYRDKFGASCFSNCDVVDLTFACIGGVDALHNCIDWIRVNPNKKAIVVCSDHAKYELNSTGEYTQGAGAIAILLSTNPRLLSIDNHWGVSTVGEHDFFKPIRRYKKKDLLQEVLDIMDHDIDLDAVIQKLHDEDSVQGVFDSNNYSFHVHKETPVFDGQYSNFCYQSRMEEAYDRFLDHMKAEEANPIESWDSIIFHLPYAFHARRIFASMYVKSLMLTNRWKGFCKAHTLDDTQPVNSVIIRSVSKTEDYKRFVQQKIEKGERASSLIGNMYTGSIFQSLMSALQSNFDEQNELTGKKIGFIAYGSGSKSKIFQGTVQKNWKSVVSNFNIWEKLEQRSPIDYDSYIQLHMNQLEKSIQVPNNEFVHNPEHEDALDLMHIRGYHWED